MMQDLFGSQHQTFSKLRKANKVLVNLLAGFSVVNSNRIKAEVVNPFHSQLQN